MNDILLLRTPLELIRKVRTQKTIPLPLIEPMPKLIGLCGHDGLKALLHISGGNSGLAYDIQESVGNYSKPEFYRLIGTSKMAVICSIKKCSPELDISPAWFGDYPFFDGQALLTQTNHKIIDNWIDSINRVPPPPKPIPPYMGLLAKAMAEI